MQSTSSSKPSALENDPNYVNTHHHLRRERRLKVLLGILTLFGTLATAAFGFAAKFIGANTPQTVNNTTVNHSQVWNGLTVLVHSAIRGSVQDSIPQPPSIVPSVVPKPAEQITPATPFQVEHSDQVSLIPGASCSGFDPKEWKVSAGEVTPLHAKDGNAYSIELRLQNLTASVKYLTFEGTPYLTDNAGNKINASPSIFGGRYTDTGARVAPEAELDVNYVSDKTQQQLGSSINNLSTEFVMTPVDSNLKFGPGQRISFGCRKLPVESLHQPDTTGN